MRTATASPSARPMCIRRTRNSGPNLYCFAVISNKITPLRYESSRWLALPHKHNTLSQEERRMNRPNTGLFPDRRAFLHVGLVGGLGLTLDQILRLEAAAPAIK